MNMLEKLAFFLGQAICHQLKARTLVINGHYLPICARDTGIYIGILCTLFFLFVTKKYRATTIPNKKNSFILLLFLFPMVFDGVLSYLHVYETSNLLRLLSGYLFGMVLPLFLIPLFHFSPDQEKKEYILTKISEVFYPFTFASILATLTYFSYIPYFILDTILSVTIILWISLIFLLVYKRIHKMYLSIGLSFCSSIAFLVVLSKLAMLLR